ncbi:MAG TPA: DUF5683 domain-containing protein [Chitinivibrionales bacterium]|jgi:hypothetical protein|nr:DUF5683 domain-containing protein [Chitinivibrionales bacterium]
MVKCISAAFPVLLAGMVFFASADTMQDSGAAPASKQGAAGGSSVAPSPGVKQSDVHKKKAVEEDLYEEMLVPEKGAAEPAKTEQAAPAAAKADTSAAKAAVSRNPADTSAAAGAAAPARAADTTHPASVPAPSAVQSMAVDTAKKSAAAAKPAAPVKIEEARAINFAKNLKEYRSPKLAMLMSLIVPGLGQAYVKSYVRAGLYILAEAAIIGTSVAYGNMANDRYNQAKAFANRNYSASKMVNYYDSLYTFILSNVTNQLYGGDHPDSDAQSRLNDIYTDSLHGFVHDSLVKSNQYYQTLDESNAYIQGWKDCQPTLDQIAAANTGKPLTDTTGRGYKYTYTRYDSIEYSYLVSISDKTTGAVVNPMAYGYSDSALVFQKLMSQYRQNSKIATQVLFILLVNHIVSAVDALISANVYNANLLGKQTFWRHIDFEAGIAGSGLATGPALAMRIQF